MHRLLVMWTLEYQSCSLSVGVGGLLGDQQLPFQRNLTPLKRCCKDTLKHSGHPAPLTPQLPLDPLDPLAKSGLFPDLGGDLFTGMDHGAVITAAERLTNFLE